MPSIDTYYRPHPVQLFRSPFFILPRVYFCWQNVSTDDLLTVLHSFTTTSCLEQQLSTIMNGPAIGLAVPSPQVIDGAESTSNALSPAGIIGIVLTSVLVALFIGILAWTLYRRRKRRREERYDFPIYDGFQPTTAWKPLSDGNEKPKRVTRMKGRNIQNGIMPPLIIHLSAANGDAVNYTEKGMAQKKEPPVRPSTRPKSGWLSIFLPRQSAVMGSPDDLPRSVRSASMASLPAMIDTSPNSIRPSRLRTDISPRVCVTRASTLRRSPLHETSLDAFAWASTEKASAEKVPEFSSAIVLPPSPALLPSDDKHPLQLRTKGLYCFTDPETLKPKDGLQVQPIPRQSPQRSPTFASVPRGHMSLSARDSWAARLRTSSGQWSNRSSMLPGRDSVHSTHLPPVYDPVWEEKTSQSVTAAILSPFSEVDDYPTSCAEEELLTPPDSPTVTPVGITSSDNPYAPLLDEEATEEPKSATSDHHEEP